MIIRRVFLATIAALVIVAAAAPSTGAANHLYLRFPQLDEGTEFRNSWGMEREGGRSHQGVDLMGTKMAPVVAVMDGVIKSLGNGDRSGYHITIDHGDGTTSWYMHLNNDTPGTDDGRGGPEHAFAEGLKVGYPVEAGQLIGYTGDSGNAEPGGAHTHFELHVRGRAVNPYPYLVDAWQHWQMELAIERGETDFK